MLARACWPVHVGRFLRTDCGGADRPRDGSRVHGHRPGSEGGSTEGGSAGRSAAPAEQRAAQLAQWREQRDTRAPAGRTVPPAVTSCELAHQRRCFFRLALGHGGAREHRQMPVETRTRRARTAFDRRHSRPAAHCYLFHDTPHPYEGTRPGQGNPIARPRHACIPVTGFTCPTGELTNIQGAAGTGKRVCAHARDTGSLMSCKPTAAPHRPATGVGI
jgi:hypothetical protein